ncbi:MAG: thioredoxin family protein [Candidatus Micrarchaeia archaeon]
MNPKTAILAIATLSLAAIIVAGCLSAPKPYEDAASPVMYFYSDSCSHCLAMRPVLTKLSDRGFRIKPMDVKANPAYWDTYAIEGTPTWIAANGDRISGQQSEYVMETWLEAHGAKIKPPKPS